MRSTPLAATVVAFGLLLGACSQSQQSAKDVKQDLSEALQEGDAALTPAQADCYANLVVDKVGVKAINKLDFKKSEPKAAVAAQLGDAAAAFRATCDVPTAP